MSVLDDIRYRLRETRVRFGIPYIFTAQCGTQSCSERAENNLEEDGDVEQPLGSLC